VDATIDLLERLVAIDSVNPTLVSGGAGEVELARFVAAWLEEHRVEVDYEELAPGRANVVGRVRGSGGGRSLMLNAHLDTVGLGGPDGGLVPRVEGSRMYGRGTYDMKGSLAAIMIAAARAAEELSLAGDLVVTAVADEEAESIGAERVAATVAADAAIVAEPTDMRVAIAHRGFVWLELETHGRAAHGSRYDLGIDAIARIGPALTGIGELDRRLAEGEAHPLLGRASTHAALVEGGTEASTYAERCVAKVERRTLPGETVALVGEQMREIAGDATVTTLFSREPLETSRDAPIVDVVLRNAGDVLGEPPEIVGVPFWTDAALLSAAGIPTVVFGPRGAGAHEATEWVDLDDVERLVEILVRTVQEFCA
jgi:acetylornithine deacetylase